MAVSRDPVALFASHCGFCHLRVPELRSWGIILVSVARIWSACWVAPPVYPLSLPPPPCPAVLLPSITSGFPASNLPQSLPRFPQRLHFPSLLPPLIPSLPSLFVMFLLIFPALQILLVITDSFLLPSLLLPNTLISFDFICPFPPSSLPLPSFF